MNQIAIFSERSVEYKQHQDWERRMSLFAKMNLFRLKQILSKQKPVMFCYLRRCNQYHFGGFGGGASWGETFQNNTKVRGHVTMLVICITGDQRRGLDQELNTLRPAFLNLVCLLDTHQGLRQWYSLSLQKVWDCQYLRLYLIWYFKDFSLVGFYDDLSRLSSDLTITICKCMSLPSQYS